jgi:hypothetical protein
MGLRILTGVLIPRDPNGNATIHFNPHEITGDADGLELNEWGERNEFNTPPGRIVSLRHFTVQDRNRAFGQTGVETEQFQVEDRPPSTHRMVIRWRATNGGEIKEIAYMIVGEA